MALNKVTYVDNETVIGAQNLNDIQDEIIANRASITTNASNIATNTEDIATNTTNIAANTSAITALQSDGVNNLGSVAAGGGTKTITIPANTRGVLFTIGSNVNQAGIFAVVCNSSGVASFAQYVSASNIDVSVSSNRMTIKNNQSSGVIYLTYVGQNASGIS